MATAVVATRTLDDCERVIERGIATFVDVGQALLEIRDGRLYRESYGTFEDYCRERWGWGRNYANKQIAAAEVVDALGTTVPTERVVRELTPLKEDPEALAETYAAAVEEHGDQPTAAQVRATVKKRAKPKGNQSEPPAHYLPDVLDTEDSLREEVVGLYAQAIKVKELLDAGDRLVPAFAGDKEELISGLDAVIKIAQRARRKVLNAQT